MGYRLVQIPGRSFVLKTYWRVIGYRLVQMRSLADHGSENPLEGYGIQTGTDPWQIMILKTHWLVIGYRLVQIPSRNGSENHLAGWIMYEIPALQLSNHRRHATGKSTGGGACHEGSWLWNSTRLLGRTRISRHRDRTKDIKKIYIERKKYN